MILDLEATVVFEKNWDALADYRIIINQGGSRSSKTYSILQIIIIKCLQDTKKLYSIVRKTLPSIKSSVLRDFKELLELYDIPYQENKTDNIYTINGNMIEFFSLDNEQKVRGSKRDVLYCNEANELSWKEYQQLAMRTSSTIFMDYNPSDSKHWIYKHIFPRKDSILIKSTFLDNPYVPENVVEELMWMKENDPDGWRVYGLGEIGIGLDNIFPNYKTYEHLPKDSNNVVLATPIGFGLDFGFTNDPTAIVKGYIHNRDIYLEEVLYRTGLTNQDINTELKILELKKNDIIYCDSAEPKSIEELRRMGWKTRPAMKGRDSILTGISTMKSFRLFIKGENIINEFTNYKWKQDRAGDNTNTPIDKYNHCADAARYLIFMTQTSKKGHYSII